MSVLSTTDSPNSSFSRHKFSIDDTNTPVKSSYLTAKPKLSSIKLLRSKLCDSSELTKKLKIHGYKYFSKIAAIGNHTASTLDIVKNSSRNLKKTFAFEFDPFNCDASFIGQFAKCFKNIRGLQDLELTIRRVKKTNETNVLVPFLSRLHKVKKLFLEIIAIQNMTENGHINILKSISKCHSLNSLECKFLNLEQPSIRYKIQTLKINRHMRRLNELKLLYSMKKRTSKDEFDSHLKHKSFHSNSLKKFTLSSSRGDRWSYCDLSKRGRFDFDLMLALPQHPNIEQVNLKFLNQIYQSEELNEVFTNLNQLKNLKSLNLEFIGCQIEDEQFFTLLEGISQLKQINHLTLNLTQNPNVSALGLQRFVQFLKKLNGYLDTFDLYFRRLILPDKIIFQSIEEINKIKSMNCSWFNESLSIKRLQN